jgi:hypothetical protein
MGTNFFRSKGFRLLMQKAGQQGARGFFAPATDLATPSPAARK